MRTYRDFQWYELKRFFRLRNLIVFGTVLILSLFFTWSNVGTFKTIQDNKVKFQDFEKKKVEQMFNYRVYGLYGFRIITIPAPISILSLHSVPFLQLTSKIDTSEQLQVYRLLKANDALRTKFKWFMDFFSFIVIFGSFLALMFGFETFWHTRYLKLLSSIGRRRPVFFGIALARSVILALFFLVALVLNYVLIALRGVSIPLTWSLPVLLVTIVLMTLCFFVLGALLGMVKDKPIAFLIGFSIFFLSLFGVPALVDYIAFGDDNAIESVYEMELKKNEILSGFETGLKAKEGIREYGGKITQTYKDEVIRYRDVEYEKIQSYDEHLIKQMEANISVFQDISVFFPTSHYLSMKYELSGSGYKHSIDFQSLVKKVKRDFLHNFVDIVYIAEKEYEKFEPFLKGDNNVIESKTNVPGQFPVGTLISIVYFSILLWQTSVKYRKTLYTLPKKDKSRFDGKDVSLKPREITEMKVKDDLFSRQMYTIMAGQGKEFTSKGYSYKVTMNGKDLVSNTEKSDFLYTCHKDHLPPDIKTGDLLSLLMRLAKTGKDVKEKILSDFDIHGISNKKIKTLDNDEFGRLLLATIHIRPFQIYILDDITKRMSMKTAVKLKDKMETLAIDNDAAFLLVTSEVYFAPGSDEKIYFIKRTSFMDAVDELEKDAGGKA